MFFSKDKKASTVITAELSYKHCYRTESSYEFFWCGDVNDTLVSWKAITSCKYLYKKNNYIYMKNTSLCYESDNDAEKAFNRMMKEKKI
jgi:hypothetical protein